MQSKGQVLVPVREEKCFHLVSNGIVSAYVDEKYEAKSVGSVLLLSCLNPDILCGCLLGIVALECCKAFEGGEIENACRASFKCYVDPCPGNCSPDATCESSYGTFTCRCPIGTYGNGRICANQYHVKLEEMIILIDADTGELISDPTKVCGCREAVKGTK